MVAGVSRQRKSHDQYHVRESAQKGSYEGVGKRKAADYSHFPCECVPERRYILRPQLEASDSTLASGVSEGLETSTPGSGVSGILESFSCLCLGGGVAPDMADTNRQSSKRKSLKRVVYPIASYTASLNSKFLVEQRRRSLPHQFFRPVASNI
eukprot:Nitzschia sp. Nitz4//scaffold290_size23356//240//698//NITZ4_008483-RA/size23356-processed-gene-0.24-mRNA-1//-1//CDS//3329546078//7175//frame0